MKKKLITLLCVLVASTIMTACENDNNKKEVTLKEEIFTVELGEKPSTAPSTYLDGERADIEKATVDISNVKDKVGSYEAEVTLGKETFEFKIEVKDTKAPKIKVKETYTVLAREEVSSDAFVESIEDAAKIKSVTIDKYITGSTEADYEKGILPVYTLCFPDPGAVSLEIIATDENGNTAKENIVITVKENAAVAEPVAIVQEEKSNTQQQKQQTSQPVEVQEPEVREPYVGNSGHTFSDFSEADSYGMDCVNSGNYSSYEVIADGNGGFTVDLY